MKRIASIFVVLCLCLSGCSLTNLPDNATPTDKVQAGCSDIQASLQTAQISLYFAKYLNPNSNFTKAQKILDDANIFLTASCAAATSEDDLVGIRNAILKAIAEALGAQTQARK